MLANFSPAQPQRAKTRCSPLVATLLGFGERKSFWNFFSCDHETAVLQSVPAFLLASTSVGPRASGEVASATASCSFAATFLQKKGGEKGHG